MTTTIISDHNGNDPRWCSAQSHGDDECFYFKHNYWLIYVPVDKSNNVKGAEKQANKYRLVFPAWKNPESAWTLAGLSIARGQGPNGLTVQPTSSLWQSRIPAQMRGHRRYSTVVCCKYLLFPAFCYFLYKTKWRNKRCLSRVKSVIK